MLKQTFSEFSEDNCMSMAAALAYYTVFSLPPLLLLIITLAGFFFSPEQVQQTIQEQAGSLIGSEGAQQLQTMISNASERVEAGGTFALALSIGGLLFGATGAFVQLQRTLNRAWEIEPDPEESGIMSFLIKRLLSLGMILVIAFFLLVSLVLNAAISALSDQLTEFLPGGVGEHVLFAVNAGVSLLIISLLFATIYKVLPDAKITWREVGIGAFATALLFVAGQFLIGLYLGQSNPGEAFGAAGSLALILVWVYYSAVILFLGAEFTQVYARRKGTGIKPEKGAVRVIQEKRHVRGKEAAS